MKVLVTSDTHGFYSPISDYLLDHEDIKLLLHAGDGASDVENIHYETDINYEFVRGNNDYLSDAPYEKVVEIENIRIFITHGHTYNVYYTDNEILKRAKELSCQIAIFGHTHQCVNTIKNDIRILNPGSISLPRDNNYSFFILDINGDSYEITRIQTNKEFK